MAKKKYGHGKKPGNYLKRQKRYLAIKEKSMSKKDIEKRKSQQEKRVAKSKEAVTSNYESNAIAKPEKFKGSGDDLKNEINATMDYIASNNDINYNWKLAGYINYAMQKLINVDNKFKFEAGKDYGAFEIAPDWDGNPDHILGYVKFNDLSNSNFSIDQSLRLVVNSDWGSKERYEYFKQTSNSERYDEIINSKENTRTGFASILSGSNLSLLKQIMYRSEMWQIIINKQGVGTKAYDSEEGRKDWGEVHDTLQTMLYEGTKSGRLRNGHLNNIKSMLDNYEQAGTTMNDLVNKINEYIDLYTK